MYINLFFTLFILSQSSISNAQTAKPSPTPISLFGFGTRPIQLSVGAHGVTRKEGGFICDLDASLGGGHYSEWGETEEDARTIVMKTCSNKSGMLLCKKDKVTCKHDK